MKQKKLGPGHAEVILPDETTENQIEHCPSDFERLVSEFSPCCHGKDHDLMSFGIQQLRVCFRVLTFWAIENSAGLSDVESRQGQPAEASCRVEAIGRVRGSTEKIKIMSMSV